jgi:GNAT superfamily N-acetyltransferase
MVMKIVPFSNDYVEEAAALVATRYHAERGINPLLSAQFESPSAIIPRLQDVVGKMPGVAAIRENRLAGFLIGFLCPLFRGVRGAFIPDWGHATDGIRVYDTYREMYASLACNWIADGRFTHAIQFFAHDREAIEAWFSSGFGMVVVDALRDLSPAQGSKVEVEIRRASIVDREVVKSLELDLHRHLAAAPTFLPLILDHGRTSREEWLADAKNALWLAYLDGEAIGFMCIEPSRQEGLPISDDVTASITGAFIRQSLRNGGVGTTLLNQVLEWARSNGYQKCAVDFESANIRGAGFWLKHFQPVCYSLARRVDERIAWANERREENDCW